MHALQLEDPEGSRLIVTRIDDSVYAIAVDLATDAPFRLFEEDRDKLRTFLRPLAG